MKTLTSKQKVAVILFNLGAPDNTDKRAIKEFLFSLFNDPNIIRLPKPFRCLLAKYLAWRRAPIVQANYRLMGKGSPLLKNTEDQAQALEKVLNLGFSANQQQADNSEYKVFVAMRYYYPRLTDTLDEIEAFKPNKILLLPLYPQFSSTTTGSSFKEWQDIMKKLSGSFEVAKVPTTVIESYWDHPKFIEAHVDLIMKALLEHKQKLNNHGYRLLFSAHGLPESIAKNDPYQSQIEGTVAAIMQKLISQLNEANPSGHEHNKLNYVICYQSKVGPLAWLKPSTEEEILRARSDKLSIILIPVAFVSEHAETLVELDIEYRALALQGDIDISYIRIPTLSLHPAFIQGLAELCWNSLNDNKG